MVTEGRHILFVGHRGHPEVIGTFGQVPEGTISLVETAADAEAIEVNDPGKLAFLTQTTLSVHDTSEIVTLQKRRFPPTLAPKGEDISYELGSAHAWTPVPNAHLVSRLQLETKMNNSNRPDQGSP